MTEKKDKPGQSKDNTPEPSVEYNPDEHHGLLALGEYSIIIEDVEQAELHKLPADIREILIQSTIKKVLAIAFATRGIDGLKIESIEPIDLDKAEVLELGYYRGLSLLAAKVPDMTLFSG